jgi:hypothetical protein
MLLKSKIFKASKEITIAISLLAFLNASSQVNLVPNPSFEDTITCPPLGIGPITFCQQWTNPTLSSPDYTNMNCIPVTILKYPRTGQGVSMIYGYNPGIPNYREYIQVKLIDTLEQNKKYCLSFYLSLCSCSGYGISTLGGYFSSTAIFQANTNNINVTPQVLNPALNILTDTVNWVNITGSFVANGTEAYLTIGNFFDDANSDTLNAYSTQGAHAYYYIDDVSVYLCDDTVQPPQNLIIPTYIKNEEYFYITGLPVNSNLQVYNAIGQIVFKENNYSQKLNTQQLSTGIYFYNLQLPSGEAYRGKVYFER